MGKSRKKTLAILSTFALLGGTLAGCGQQDAASSDEITIMTSLHTPEIPDPKIEEMLEEATGEKIKIQWVPDGSFDEKVSTTFATGTLPQAVYMRNMGVSSQFRDAVSSGQFWEVGPYLEEYEHLSNLDSEVLKNTAVDGKFYGIYQERPLSRQGIIYRKDWADNLGLSAPETIDDLYEMAKAFTNDDPDQNGKNDTIGLTDRNDLIYGAFKTVGSYFGTPNNWGEVDGQLQPEFMHPSYMDTMKFIRQLHKEGLINQDFPVTSKTDQINQFVTGKAGMYIGAMGDVLSLHTDAVKINPDIELDVQNRIEGPEGLGIWSIPGYSRIVVFPKSSIKTEEDLKRVLAFYDKLMSPELANLMQYGVEGEHYELVDDQAEMTDDQGKFDREVKAYNALVVGGPETIDMLEPYFELEVKAKAEELVKDNNEILINDPAAPLHSDTQLKKGTRLQEMIDDATYQFMVGKIDEKGFNKVVENWKKDGGDQIIKEYNEAFKKQSK
ncbi:extracellular solute-binding protein [Desmospora activa]|uniref:Carbohydrate ABC transporter substrate-binding protein (CUT1 family) n=1 Tax=Desmospora activa DSM 45169 TaxID=1121389 RepID=A0A2T4Z3V4_9BACL|nr:extracellular solute-binding protein [Desmospora activa]PTM56572.1 carbohydrate ABC transporter substrate-binding protein (CUT1 family) [Desmospora activa DSM 45169]